MCVFTRVSFLNAQISPESWLNSIICDGIGYAAGHYMIYSTPRLFGALYYKYYKP